jgi:hypothetical protein
MQQQKKLLDQVWADDSLDPSSKLIKAGYHSQLFAIANRKYFNRNAQREEMTNSAPPQPTAVLNRHSPTASTIAVAAPSTTSTAAAAAALPAQGVRMKVFPPATHDTAMNLVPEAKRAKRTSKTASRRQSLSPPTPPTPPTRGRSLRRRRVSAHVEDDENTDPKKKTRSSRRIVRRK